MSSSGEEKRAYHYNFQFIIGCSSQETWRIVALKFMDNKSKFLRKSEQSEVFLMVCLERLSSISDNEFKFTKHNFNHLKTDLIYLLLSQTT
jgi:hypothetical protein